MRTAASVVLLAVELALAAYASLIAWLFCVWMINDDQVATMTSRDWYAIGALRFGTVALAAASFGLLTYLLNGNVMRSWLERRRVVRLLLSVIPALAIVGAAAIGAIEFVTTKAYM